MSTKELLKKVGESVKVEPIAKEFILNSFDLTERATDAEIDKALGENHLFDQAEVYSLIGNLISKQSEGEEGALLNNGNANLFYTKQFVVRVGWGGSDWDLSTWRRDGYVWYAEYRVFSPAV